MVSEQRKQAKDSYTDAWHKQKAGGEKEKETGTVTVRMRDGKNLPPMSVSEFTSKVLEECQEGRGI